MNLLWRPVLRRILGLWLGVSATFTSFSAPVAAADPSCAIDRDVAESLEALFGTDTALTYRGTLLLEYGADREFISVDVDRAAGVSRLHYLNRQSEQSRKMGVALSAPRGLCNLMRYYSFRLEAGRVVAGRPTKRLQVAPRDTLRLGYMMDLDSETGLPLRVVTADPEGQILERYEFAEIELLPAQAVATASSNTMPEPGLEFRGLPPGFTVIWQSELPVAHVVVSDGLSVASVYLEPKPPALPLGEGVFWRGASLSYTLGRADGGLITVLGQVPVTTARLLAEAVDR